MTAVVQEGEVLAGKYRVEKVLGTGGMGYVVACQHIHLQQKVALKFLHSSMLESEEVVGRFLREAQAAVQIKSEHVVRVSDVGKLDDGAPYMVMEYLEGTDLKETLEKRGPFPIATAVDYVLQACEALAEAHVLGIVHRDLKPNNLFLARKADGRDCVKVLDFGISKVNSSTPGIGNLTKTTSMLGTPYYMAPEQLTNTRNVDARADIWALGIVLYELISGATPFTGETLTELCIRIVQDQPVPLSSLNPAVPPALWNVITRCLQKDREGRYANVAEVAFALAAFGTASSQISLDTISRIIPGHLANSRTALADAAAPVVALGTAPTSVERPQTGATGLVAWGNTKTSTGHASRKSLILVLSVATLVVIGAVGWLYRSRAGTIAAGSSAPAELTAPMTVRAADLALQHPATAPQALLTSVASATAVAPPATPAEGPPIQAAASTPAPSPSASGMKNSVSPPVAAGTNLQKRPKSARGELGAKPNSENLIEDRR